MKALRAYWNAFWFTPERPDNLGLLRALFYGLLLVFYATESWAEWADVSQAFWFPITLFKVLRLPVVSASALVVLGLLWKLSLLTSALGLFSRASALVAAAVGCYLLGLPHNFGKTHHFDAMVVLILGILACSRTADVFSLDRWLARRRGVVVEVVASGEYRWPVRAAWLVMSLVFFSAGFAKLYHGGLEWMVSDNMSSLLLQHGYQGANENPPVRIGLWVAQHPILCNLLAVGTVIIEFFYPLALFSRWARRFFPLGMCVALIGIRLMMGPTFFEFILCHVFWIPWDRVATHVGSWGRERLFAAAR
jgi:hypothetical protein